MVVKRGEDDTDLVCRLPRLELSSIRLAIDPTEQGRVHVGGSRRHADPRDKLPFAVPDRPLKDERGVVRERLEPVEPVELRPDGNRIGSVSAHGLRHGDVKPEHVRDPVAPRDLVGDGVAVAEEVDRPYVHVVAAEDLASQCIVGQSFHEGDLLSIRVSTQAPCSGPQDAR